MQRTLRDIRPKFVCAGRWAAGLTGCAMLMLAALLWSSAGHAGQERYEYDPIGRLILFVDSSNQVTEYTYDAAGNILAVKRVSAASLAPTITGISPSVVRRGETKTLTLTGERLQSGTLQAVDPGIGLSNVQQTATQVTAQISVATSVPIGTQTLTLTSAVGSSSVGLLIAPKLPTLSVEPSPLALPPDNTARGITLRLSNSDLVDHDVSIASSDTGKATVSPATVRFIAGQTTLPVQVTPKAAGFVTLTLTSPTLATVTGPVFITADFRGVNTSYAAPVGVQVGEVQATPPATTTGPFAAPRVGVAVGPMLTSVSPTGMTIGASHDIVLGGAHLPAVMQASVVPPTGVTASIESAGPQQLTFKLDIAANAPAGRRRLVITDGAGVVVPFADPAMSQLRFTTGQPVIDSIEPLFGVRGTTLRLKVRGRHLQDGQLVLSPATDLRVDSAPVVSADGTELVAGIQIAALAAGGARTVQVVTPSGRSSEVASSANQFTVVSEVTSQITPIASPLVGVVVGTASTPGTNTASFGPLQAATVGVVVGEAASGLTPKVGLIDSSPVLTVTGSGLQAVQTVTFVPATGITVGAATPNAEGTSLSIPVTIAADAPRVPRRLVLNTAAGRVSFTPPHADQFMVVAPAPELVSVTPQVLPTGKTTAVTLRGRNLSDLQGVRLEPAAGITAIGPFTASEGNTVLNFTVQVGAGVASGARTVIVDAAGGSSSSDPVPANTVHIAQQVGPTYDSITAPVVGVQVGATSTPQTTTSYSLNAPLVGVVVTPTVAPSTSTTSVYAGNVGVVVGSVLSRVDPRSPDGFLKGTTGTLTLHGFALDAVTSVVASGTGVTFGAPTVSADATQLAVPVTVAPAASSTYYGVQVSTGSGTATLRITSIEPASMLFNVGSLPSAVDSVSPIVLEQGKTYNFTVRGVGLKDVYRVFAEPSQGLNFAPAGGNVQWSTDVLGEKLSVPITIDGAAAIGSRVIRLRVPGGSTSSEATPANTITIVAPQ